MKLHQIAKTVLSQEPYKNYLQSQYFITRINNKWSNSDRHWCDINTLWGVKIHLLSSNYPFYPENDKGAIVTNLATPTDIIVLNV